MENHVGIAGLGIYLPEGRITAAELAAKTNGSWSEQAFIKKLGIVEKTLPGEEDGTQEMGAKAAMEALKDGNINPLEVDVILSISGEWKEYPLTTSACYIAERAGMKNAWGIDLQNRCCTTLSAMKIAKDMLLADDEIQTVMIAGGYRNGDLIDYTDNDSSFLFNLSAGGGAIVLKKNFGKNKLLGSHTICDSSLARSVGVKVGGTKEMINADNLSEANILRVMEPEKMKKQLNQVSIENWTECIKKSFEKSGLEMKIDYLATLHFKRSQHIALIKELGISETDNTIFLENYGHIGQIDQILSLKLALECGKVKDGDNVTMLAAGIGYVWAANVIVWG